MDEDINPNFYRTPLGTVVEKNPKKTYPHLYSVFLLTSHDTSWFWVREDGTCYWEHTRKNKDKVTVEADGLQLDLFGEPILSKKFIMEAVL